VEICGDGLVVGTENCDDGKKDDDIGCALGCKSTLPKWVCSTNPSTKKSECLPKCKDGFVVEGEKCDAGSDPKSDGCSNDCKGVV